VEDPFKETLKPEMLKAESGEFRSALGILPEHILYGRFSRPEPNKWTPLVLDAFLAAYRENPNIRFLLREPPPAVAQHLISSGLATWAHDCQLSASQPFSISVFLLPATADPHELAVSQMSCDVVLHTSSFGESFGYGIAEPMALGKPVITNSTPWRDQAQVELVRHCECGLIASTVPSMEAAILRMAASAEWRAQCGTAARKHILSVADPEESTDRVEMAMQCAIEDRDNPVAEQDLEKAIKTAEYLDEHQWGHGVAEQLHLRAFTAKVLAIRGLHFLKKKLAHSSLFH
jgi:glycosyltransferase involved in cell wall biosynthesis